MLHSVGVQRLPGNKQDRRKKTEIVICENLHNPGGSDRDLANNMYVTLASPD